MWRQKKFILSYKYFEPGTLVTSCSELSELTQGVIYRVHSCCEPHSYNDICVAFLEGWVRAIPTYYLMEVKNGNKESDQA